jgi:SAM-dependent methyltransferase
MDPYVEANRELWDEWTSINLRSSFYDVDGFRRAPTPLDPLVRAGLGELAGARVLHLQCHFGLDTLRVAREAREVVGVDLSPRAIAAARALATELGLPARFIESDVLALPAAPDGPHEGTFDVVFSSYGAIEWLGDLRPWGQLVARYLRPGGHFFLADTHPAAAIFDERTTGELRVAYPYFRGEAPIAFPPAVGNYADPTAPVTKTAYSWPHALSEVVMALLDAGLRLDELREHSYAVWKMFPFAVPAPDHGADAWQLPPELPRIPLMFSLRATRPAGGAGPG